MSVRTLLVVVGLAAALVCQSHEALALTTVSAGAGVSYGSGDGNKGVERASPFFSGELTLGAGDVIQLGAFYDYNSLSSSNKGLTPDGSVDFFGGVARMGFDFVSNLFIDGKFGFTHTSNGNYSSDTNFGFGLGVGYMIQFDPIISLRPRVGYRYLPNNSGLASLSRNMLDLNVLLSFSL